MLILTRKADLSAHLEGLRNSRKTLGFVPTMGALHMGHLSLLAEAKKSCDVVICSIFVNPTQFNDKKDLENYPRNPEKDIKILENSPCDLLFMPEVEEMYGKEPPKSWDFGYLDKILEGAHRPGHFNGVAQIVSRFFELIEPDMAFFGSKDFQQVMIVKQMAARMNSRTKIIACPIVREEDGLAMSSRNMLLSPDERKTAGAIPRLMQEAKKIAQTHSIGAAKLFVAEQATHLPAARLVYYEICEADTLKTLDHLSPGKKAVSLIAIYVGKIRLIDNLEMD